MEQPAAAPSPPARRPTCWRACAASSINIDWISESFRVSLQDLIARAGAFLVGESRRISRDLQPVAFHFLLVGVLEADGLTDQRPFAGGNFVVQHRFRRSIGSVVLDEGLAVFLSRDGVADELLPGRDPKQLWRSRCLGGCPRSLGC